MAIKCYDEAIVYKLKKWIPDSANMRILRPEESKRLFELTANDRNDAPLKLPFIALSRNDDIEMQLNTKNSRSFDGLKLASSSTQTVQLNVIPIKLIYQLDIYTKTSLDGEEYLRNFLFKLINNPLITIDIPYNGSEISHFANIRVLETVSNTSDMSERLFAGQFNRWTMLLEIQDAFLFSIPYRDNWRVEGVTMQMLLQDQNTPNTEDWSRGDCLACMV